ncbi:MAG TPA: hypothetical protein GXZ23_06150 [Clostridiales bacterium]|jgi:flagellar basal body-associated protein FliL|nr:hypothetical protein [Clostridiales bacterium]
MKKALKIIAIIAAIAGVAAVIYAAVTKYMNKKQAVEDEEENYVSCSCCDDEFIAESIA